VPGAVEKNSTARKFRDGFILPTKISKTLATNFSS